MLLQGCASKFKSGIVFARVHFVRKVGCSAHPRARRRGHHGSQDTRRGDIVARFDGNEGGIGFSHCRKARRFVAQYWCEGCRVTCHEFRGMKPVVVLVLLGGSVDV